jgi:hypothetical protein
MPSFYETCGEAHPRIGERGKVIELPRDRHCIGDGLFICSIFLTPSSKREIHVPEMQGYQAAVLELTNVRDGSHTSEAAIISAGTEYVAFRESIPSNARCLNV